MSSIESVTSKPVGIKEASRQSLQDSLSTALRLLDAIATDTDTADTAAASEATALAGCDDLLSGLTKIGQQLLAERGLPTSIVHTVESRLRADASKSWGGQAGLRDRWLRLVIAEVKSTIARAPAAPPHTPASAASVKASAAKTAATGPALSDLVFRTLRESGALAEAAEGDDDPVLAREREEAAARVRSMEAEVAALRDAFPIDWDREAGRLSFMAGRLGVLVVLDVGSERAIRLLSVSGQGLPAGCIPPPADAPLVKWLQCLDCEFHAPPTPEHQS